MKTCSACAEIKGLESFNKDSRTKDGRNYVCKVCERSKRLLHRQVKEKELSEDEGPELPEPKQTGTCRYCAKALFGNRYYHFDCLDEESSGFDDVYVYM